VRPRGLVVAVDGPSGAGKSTAARALAAALGYTFVDTGAMYRALALRALREGADLDSENDVGSLAERCRIELVEAGRVVLLDGERLADAIRKPEVSDAASRISAHPRVRRRMVALQREAARDGGVVLDGRDIGTIVFPDADVKFYIDAEPSCRAERRHAELVARGDASNLSEVEQEIRERDRKDMTRVDSPLTRATDAILLDTTRLSPQDVLEQMLQRVNQRLVATQSR
jgi:cytidylate kinase